MKNVIFDLGNVLINFDLNVFYKRINEACGRSLPDIETGYLSEILDALEIGAIPTDRFAKIFRFEWDLKWSADDWANNYALCYQPNPHGQALARRAKEQGYNISILSNLADFHRVGVERTYPGFLDQFDHTFYSFEMGVAKPDKTIYEKVCDALSCNPEECVFLDDKNENVSGAIAAGMTNSLVFKESNYEAIDSILF